MDNEEVRDETPLEEQPVVVSPDPELSRQDDTDKADGDIAKRLKDTQAAFTKASQERAEERKRADALEQRLAQMEGMLTVLKDRPAAPEKQEVQTNPFEFLDDPYIKERFYEDADVPIKAMKQTVDIIGRALVARDLEWTETLKKFKDELLNQVNRPDPAIAAKIVELRKDPELANLDDKALAILAKRLPATETAERREYPGAAPSGSRRPAPPASDPAWDKAIKAKMKEIYGDA